MRYGRLDPGNADWLPRRRATLPEGVTDAASLRAYLAQIGQSLSGFLDSPAGRSLAERYPWLAALRR